MSLRSRKRRRARRRVERLNRAIKAWAEESGFNERLRAWLDFRLPPVPRERLGEGAVVFPTR
jgi:hypothetical protein